MHKFTVELADETARVLEKTALSLGLTKVTVIRQALTLYFALRAPSVRSITVTDNSGETKEVVIL